MAVPNPAEQVEPQHNAKETTTTPNSVEQEDTNRTEPQPTTSPQTEEPTTLERNEPAEPDPTTEGGVDTMETRIVTEQGQGVQPGNDAPTKTMLVSDQNILAEPNILEILEDE